MKSFRKKIIHLFFFSFENVFKKITIMDIINKVPEFILVVLLVFPIKLYLQFAKIFKEE